MKKGNLIIISSPSGGGKGTLIREIMPSVPDLGYSISHTTRKPRFGEEHGREYYFVSREQFDESIAKGRFLEYAEVHGNMYGTSREQIEDITGSGRDAILEIDVQGALAVMEKVPTAVSIFILPPSFAVLKARLTARNTEDANDLAVRLRNSFAEVQNYTRFDYVIVNEEVPIASRHLASVICGERQRRDRQTERIASIIESFAGANHSTIGF